jgi:pimeloyl-ACP methyl ester carboxylesterase
MERLLELGGASVRSTVTDLPGGAIHHLEAGAGPPLVLVHGASGGGANWYRVIGTLARRFRVLAPDLPGFGLSPARPTHAPLGRRAAEHLAQWLGALGTQPAFVMGTSFGGLAALRLVQLRPERVRGLVLLDSVGLGRRIAWSVRLAALAPFAPLVRRPSRRSTAFLLDHLMIDGPGALPAAHRSALIDFLYAVEHAGAAELLARTLAHFVAPGGQREILHHAELAAVTARTLVVWGERDRLLPPAHGHRTAAAMPHARFEMIGGAGHSPNWEAPDRLLALLDGFFDGA